MKFSFEKAYKYGMENGKPPHELKFLKYAMGAMEQRLYNKNLCESFNPGIASQKDLNLKNFLLPRGFKFRNIWSMGRYSMIPDEIYYKKKGEKSVTFTKGKKLGMGGEGVVYSYISDNKREVALKIITLDKSDKNLLVLTTEEEIYATEEEVIKRLEKIQLNCKFVNGHSLGHLLYKDPNGQILDNFYIIMDKLDGDLSKLASKLDDMETYTIFIEVARQLQCLFDNGIVYTDIKVENVFYKCVEAPHYFQIYIGDLGGFTFKEFELEKGITTFPPPEYEDTLGGGIDSDEKNVVWALGIFFLQLISGGEYIDLIHGYFGIFVDGSQENINKMIDEKVKNPRINKIVKGCLEKNPEKRFTFLDIFTS